MRERTSLCLQTRGGGETKAACSHRAPRSIELIDLFFFIEGLSRTHSLVSASPRDSPHARGPSRCPLAESGGGESKRVLYHARLGKRACPPIHECEFAVIADGNCSYHSLPALSILTLGKPRTRNTPGRRFSLSNIRNLVRARFRQSIIQEILRLMSLYMKFSTIFRSPPGLRGFERTAFAACTAFVLPCRWCLLPF